MKKKKSEKAAEDESADEQVESEDGAAAPESGSAGGDSAEEEADLDPEAQIQKWRERAMRNQADLENYRKRMTREKTDAVLYANSSLLQALLPILDSFDMGLQAARSEGEDSVIFQGMTMVKKQLDEFLAEEGVETIQTEGEAFDPNRHEAVQQEHSDDVPEGVIISEVRKGFRLRDRLLRPANVVISKGPKTEPEPVEAESDA